MAEEFSIFTPQETERILEAFLQARTALGDDAITDGEAQSMIRWMTKVRIVDVCCRAVLSGHMLPNIDRDGNMMFLIHPEDPLEINSSIIDEIDDMLGDRDWGDSAG